MRSVNVVPVVIGALLCDKKGLKNGWKHYKLANIGVVQKTTLLGTAHTLRTVLKR